MVQVFDITRPIYHGMPVYAGDPAVTVQRRFSILEGAPANVSALSLGSHTGTHVDAPAHFREGGVGVDRLPLDVLLGPARLYHVRTSGPLDATRLRELDLRSRPRVLFKTLDTAPHLEEGFRTEGEGLTPDAARLLVDSDISLVGVDALSVEPAGSTAFGTHRILLDVGIIILEGLDLSVVPPGEYELLCLPLNLRDGDGAPARAILREMTGSR